MHGAPSALIGPRREKSKQFSESSGATLYGRLRDAAQEIAEHGIVEVFARLRR
jgi:hypothetical protein